jgi:succinoglycan biosynthesis protein ExoA
MSPADDRAFVVIPCLNEAARISNLLHELLSDPAWRDPLIVVADGGSTDGSLDAVKAFAERDRRVRLMHNPQRLQSAAVNAAARAHGAGRRWLVRVDAHASYSDDYVSTLIEQAQATGADAVVVAMRSLGATCFERGVAAAQNSRLGAGGSAHRSDGAEGFVDHGHHALIDLGRFLAVGGYDESFSHNEDAELDVRLATAGARIWLTRAASMTYHPRGDAPALFQQYFAYGAGRARTLLKHRLRPRLRQLLPLAVPPALALALAWPWFPWAAAPAVAWATGCLGWGLWLGGRAWSRCAAGSGVPAMIIHLAFGLGFWREALRQGLRRKPALQGATPPATAT